MKTMKKFLSMAALAMVGAMTVSCSSDDNFIDQPQQPETKNNVVTLTTTVGFDEATGSTRALAIDYGAKTLTKTFAEGEQIALIYKQTGGTTAKAVSAALTPGDISADGKSANFTFELTDPNKSRPVTYIYPAAMAGATGVDYSKLDTQDGTLASIASNLDCAWVVGMWTGDALPNVTMTNAFAIIAYTLKDETGANDITSTITGMTIKEGTNTYTITGKDADGHIYAAIQPTDNANIEYTATDGTKKYTKSVTDKNYAKGEFYQQGLRMTQGANLSLLTADYTAQDGDKLTGTLTNNVKISIADGATVTLKDLNINGSGTWTSDSYAGITCAGDATITLEGTNTVKGFANGYPGIFVSSGKTLVINGTGELNASSNGSYNTGTGGAGIGAGNNMSCGNIEIQSGTVTATGNYCGAGIGGGQDANCGNITISGGTVTATGGQFAAGIGGGKRGFIGGGQCGNITISGGTITATGGENAAGIGGGKGRNNSNQSSCGTITITSGVTSVTATKGSSATNSIGAGEFGTCGTVTIDAGANVTQN